MKIKTKLLIVGLLLAFANTAIAGVWFFKNVSPVIEQQRTNHGTHLCSDDEHCGSGHKCCDGHCMMVSTCGD